MDNVFKFQIVSLGSSMQPLKDSHKVINRPMIDVNGEIKKWGDEYVILCNEINNTKDISDVKFLGSFSLDTKHRKYLKLFKEIDIPIHFTDYYIVTMKVVTSSKINKTTDFAKSDPDSLSCILSCAYNKIDNVYENEMIIVCKHNDCLVVDGEDLFFDDMELKFVK